MPETLELMRTPQLPYSGQPGNFIALPWVVADTGLGAIADHEGATFGQTARLTLIPEQSFAISVLTNHQNGIAVAAAALDAAIAAYFIPEQPAGEGPPSGSPGQEQAQPTVAPAPVTPDPAEMQQYVGRYEIPVGAHNLEVVDGMLFTSFEVLDWPGQILPSNAAEMPPFPTVPLIFVSEDHAVLGSLEAPLGTISFLRDDDGAVQWLVDTGRLYPRMQ
jgi:hypothetical protein